MKKTKRILAAAGAILLFLMYLSTLIFALIDHPAAFALLRASIGCTILIPVLLYAGILVYRVLHHDQDKDDER